MEHHQPTNQEKGLLVQKARPSCLQSRISPEEPLKRQRPKKIQYQGQPETFACLENIWRRSRKRSFCLQHHSWSRRREEGRSTCFFLMSLRAAMSSGASEGTLVTTPVPGGHTQTHTFFSFTHPTNRVICQHSSRRSHIQVFRNISTTRVTPKTFHKLERRQEDLLCSGSYLGWGVMGNP